MPNRIAAFGWSIELPPGWLAELREVRAAEETTTFLAIVPETNDALLRFTPDEYGRIESAAEWVRRVDQIHNAFGRPVAEIQCGDLSGNRVEFEADSDWIRGWAICAGSAPIDATYRCNFNHRGRDDQVVDRMMTTLRIEASAVNCKHAIVRITPESL